MADALDKQKDEIKALTGQINNLQSQVEVEQVKVSTVLFSMMLITTQIYNYIFRHTHGCQPSRNWRDSPEFYQPSPPSRLKLSYYTPCPDFSYLQGRGRGHRRTNPSRSDSCASSQVTGLIPYTCARRLGKCAVMLHSPHGRLACT